jgi:hypothetical protein
MKWLRETSIQYIPGVEFDGENINFQNNNISWNEDYFTILPLADGKLTIRAYDPGRLITGITVSPQNDITVDYRPKGTSAWISLSFSGGSIGFLSGNVIKNVTLTAGVPIELKCSTGLTRVVTPSLKEATIYPGHISTDCPAIIMGQLESLAVGDISTSGTPGELVNDPAHTVPWVNYLDGLRELFKGWTTLIDASNLRMPDQFNSASVNPDFTGLFSGCSNLISSPRIVHAGIYTRCFEDCVSLRSVYANFSPSGKAVYTLTDWLKGTHAGDRTIYVPDTLDSGYDLCLPIDPTSPLGNKSWTRKIFEF